MTRSPIVGIGQFLSGKAELNAPVFISHPSMLSDIHAGKIVLTGGHFSRIREKEFIYTELQEKITPKPNEIKVVSLVQQIGTMDPEITDYIFDITSYRIYKSDTHGPVIEGGRKITVSLPIGNPFIHKPRGSHTIRDTFLKKIVHLITGNK